MIGRVVASVGFLGGGLWWTGLVSSDTVAYNLPAAEVQSRLEHAGLPPLVFGDEEPGSAMQSDPNRVTWLVMENGSEVMRYVLDITSGESAHTKIHVALERVTQGPFGNVDQRLRGDRTLRNLYLTAMKEQVDSVLTNHPFRYSAISGATAAATVAHIGALSDWMDQAAEAQHRQDRANMDKAYRDAGLD